MTDNLSKFAQETTPQSVTVSPGWNSLIVWAVGRFGAGAIMAGIMGYAACVLYDDMKAEGHVRYTDQKETDKQWLTAYAQQTAAQVEFTKSNWYLYKAITDLTSAVTSQKISAASLRPASPTPQPL